MSARLVRSLRRGGRLASMAAIAGLAAVAAVRLASPRAGQTRVVRPEPGVPVSKATSMLQLTFGLVDLGRLNWDGELRLSEGRVLGLDARLEPGEALEGNRWRLRSRAPTPLAMHIDKSSPVRLFAYLDAPSSARVEILTRQGPFSFVLDEIGSRTRPRFMGGQVGVERLVPSTRITTGATEDDSPALAVGLDGAAWMTYVAYTRRQPRSPGPGGDAGRPGRQGRARRVGRFRPEGKRGSAPADALRRDPLVGASTSRTATSPGRARCGSAFVESPSPDVRNREQQPSFRVARRAPHPEKHRS
jgi:hypothetical protein